MSYYIHTIPGRMRIKIPSIKGNPLMGETIQKFIASIQGVLSTALNPLTGSITIHYDFQTVRSDQILNLLDEKGYFDLSKAITNDQYIQRSLSNAGHFISRALFGFFVDKALEGAGLSFLAVLI